MTKRRMPGKAEVHRLFLVVGIVSLVFLVFAVFGIITNTRSILPFFGILFALFGIPLGIWALYALKSPGSPYNVFRRSSRTTRAKVLDRYIKSYGRDESGNEALVPKVIVQFNAARLGGAVEQVTLEARVSMELYESLRPGRKIKVRYATEDPSIALFAGE